MTTITLIAALFSLGLTFLVLWANPHRFSNQVFALVLLVQTGWLACVHRAMLIGLETPQDWFSLERWLRANAAVISFLPATMWLLKSAITTEKRSKHKVILKSLPLLILSIVSATICFTPSFVYQTQSGIVYRGTAYYVQSIFGLLLYSIFVIDTIRRIRSYNGIRRIELQFLALNAGGAALLLLGLNAIGNLLQNRTFTRLGVLLVFAATALTAAALVAYRVFNAREVFLQFGHRLWFVLTLSGGIYGLWCVTADILPEPFGLLLSVAIVSPLAFWFDKITCRWFDVNGAQELAALRQCAMEIERTSSTTSELLQRFTTFFRNKFDIPEIFFISDVETVETYHRALTAKGTLAYRILCTLHWATPESLDRRRATPANRELKAILETNGLGLVVAVPNGSPDPSLIVAITKRQDERPFTFPEIERIQNLVGLIDGIIARSRLVDQTTQKARTELVVNMSSGLAHDLKNLITPISTFFSHIEHAIQTQVTEMHVYSSAKCAVRKMTDYVWNALSFPDRSGHHFEAVTTTEICAEVRDIVSLYAAERDIQLRVVAPEGDLLLGDRILLERMLGNVLRNAIEASSPGQTVLLEVLHLGGDWVRFEVRDEGCGVPTEYISRVFERSFTTKTGAEGGRGFGLGLTIAQQVAMLHGGQIQLESKPHQTRVYVDLPVRHLTTQLQTDLHQPSPA